MDFIELYDVHKSYRRGEMEIPVLRGITLSIRRGEMVALTGASGSGKSTLMNILGCLDRPTSGGYFLDGQEMSSLTPEERALVRNHKIGFIFQNFNLLPRTSAINNVVMPLTYTASHLSRQETYEKASQMLKRVGLGDRLDYHPSQLSGGQQQRVAIARALVNNPPLLFADEPSGNLDSRTSAEILQMFREFNREDGITIILVTHDAEVAQNAQRVVHIKDGVIENGIFQSHVPGTRV